MGFFKNLVATDPETDRIRTYLADAPPGPRQEWLMWSAVQRIAQLPVASASSGGTAVTVADLAPASQIVRDVMEQDRELSAQMVRKAVVSLQHVFGGGMAGDFPESFDAGFATMGLDSPDRGGGVVFRGRAGDGIAEDQSAASKSLADFVIMFMQISVSPADERSQQPGWSTYVDLHTRPPGVDFEALAYDLVARVAVLIGRLRNSGQLLDNVSVFFAPVWRRVPALTEAGWYPAPNRTAKLVNGVAPLQRYWDGAAWTDRVRVRSNGDWRTGSFPLHDPPDPTVE